MCKHENDSSLLALVYLTNFILLVWELDIDVCGLMALLFSLNNLQLLLYISIYLYLYLYIYIYIYLYLSINQSIYLSIYLSTYLYSWYCSVLIYMLSINLRTHNLLQFPYILQISAFVSVESGKVMAQKEEW